MTWEATAAARRAEHWGSWMAERKGIHEAGATAGWMVGAMAEHSADELVLLRAEKKVGDMAVQ